MDVIIVAGFLGSGKTTIIINSVARIYEITGKRSVIIVNDFGKVTVDGRIMERCGLKVMDLVGGCICCSLGSFLLDTIKKVATELDPDIIIIEPSGIADPEQILNTLEEYTGPPIDSIKTIVVVDASRFEAVSRHMSIPFKNQLKSADSILINKVDLVSREEPDRIEGRLREMGFSGSIMQISATKNSNLDDVVGMMVKT